MACPVASHSALVKWYFDPIELRFLKDVTHFIAMVSCCIHVHVSCVFMCALMHCVLSDHITHKNCVFTLFYPLPYQRVG